MKKLLITGLLTFVLFLSFHTAQAQRLFFIAAHAGYNAPSGATFSDAYNFGLGAEAIGGIGWGGTFITGTLGYNWFKATSSYKNELGGGNMSSTPIKLGLRQYIFARLLYLKIDGGVAYTQSKLKNASRFTADAGVGAKLAGFDLGLDFNTLNYGVPGTDKKWNNWVGFKAGWHFGL
jgi:opacity protein-like surface antigen